MTKKTNTTNPTISRRAAIAGPLAAAIGVAEAAAPDPIFPILEKLRLAQDALSNTIKAADLPREQWSTSEYAEVQTELNNNYAAFRKALLDLLTTMPTTRAGLAALFVTLGKGFDDVEQPNLLIEAMCWEDETRQAGCTVLKRLAALVLKMA